jgi:hypothetical protein
MKRTLFIAIVIALLLGCVPAPKEAPVNEPQPSRIIMATLPEGSLACATPEAIKEITLAIYVEDWITVQKMIADGDCGVTSSDLSVQVLAVEDGVVFLVAFIGDKYLMEMYTVEEFMEESVLK